MLELNYWSVLINGESQSKLGAKDSRSFQSANHSNYFCREDMIILCLSDRASSW